MAVAKTEWVTLTDAALQLSMRYQAALNLALCRRLVAEKRDGKWLVEQRSIDRMLRERDERKAVPA